MQLSILVASVGGEPFALGSPVHFLGLPGIDTTAGETQGLEAHGLHGDRARENQQVGPGDLSSVLLLDRPEQAGRLFQVCVVGPTVERREALQTAVAPVLRSGHQLFEIRLECGQVETLELLRIVEIFAQGTGFQMRLAQRLETQPVGPPIVMVGASWATARLTGASGEIPIVIRATTTMMRPSIRFISCRQAISNLHPC